MSLVTNEDRRFDSGAVPAPDVSRFNLMSMPVLSDWEWRAELALIRALCALAAQIVHVEQKFSLVVLYAVVLEISQTPQSSSSSHSLSVFCLLCRCSWRNVTWRCSNNSHFQVQPAVNLQNAKRLRYLNTSTSQSSCYFKVHLKLSFSVICGLTGKFELEPRICTSVVIVEILHLMDTLTTPSRKKYFSQP